MKKTHVLGVCMGLVGSSWSESNLAITCQISRLSTPGARATEPGQDPRLRCVQAGRAPACPAAESVRKDALPEEKTFVLHIKSRVLIYLVRILYKYCT